METPERLSFRELVSLYPFEGPADEVVSDSKPERLAMHDENAFQSHLLVTAGNSVEKFRNASQEGASTLPIRHRDPHRPAVRDLRRLELSRTQVDPASPLEFSVSKLWKTDVGGNESQRVDFDLHRGQDVIGSMYAYVKEDRFNLDHRVVDSRFRGEKYGNSKKSLADLLLEAEENFVKAAAKKDQRSKTQTVETGQLDVMCWLWNYGYKPIPQDEDTFHKILAGDSGICRGLRNYMYWRDKTDISERNGSFVNWPKAAGVTFIKDFSPEIGDEVVSLREATSGRVDDTFRGA